MQPEQFDPSAVEATLDEMVRRVQADTDRVMQLQSTLETMEIVGYADRGAVTVRLLGSGRFTAVEIDPAVLRSADAHAVGQLVLDGINDGLRRLHERGRAVFAPVVAGPAGERP